MDILATMASTFPDLIPGLPDDLALLCLAWLPRRLHPLASCVSRAWHRAFQSHALLSIRRQIGAHETWLFLCLQGDTRDPHAIYTFTYSWWLLDPALCPQYDPLPSPPFPPVQLLDYDAVTGQGEVLLAACAYCRMDAGIATPMEEICRLDLFRKRWQSPSPPNMLTRRHTFACAYLDGCTYVAGGRTWDYTVHGVDETNGAVCPLKCVERLDCTTMSSWETLPDMHIARVGAAGVVLNGCFCVIGGYDGAGNIYSGEMWDVRSQKWILVPELWPHHIFKDSCNPGSSCNVVVVMGTLFAINHAWEAQTELMMYNATFKVWTSLGLIPLENFYDQGTIDPDMAKYAFCQPFEIGKELWVVVHPNGSYDAVFIIACSPLSSEPSMLSWRRLPYSFHYFNMYLGLAISI